MLIHEKILSGQFLLDLKNEHANLLHQCAQPTLHPTNHHHQLHHPQQHLLQLPAQYAPHRPLPPSPPLSDLNMDLYAAYAYQQQLQQQLMHQQQLMQQHQTLIREHQVLNHQHSQQQQHLQQLQKQQPQQQQQQPPPQTQQNHIQIQQNAVSAVSVTPELVLDLSRRLNSAETSPTSRKTPSPTQTHSSFDTASPSASPTASHTNSPAAELQPQPQPHQTIPAIPSNLIYSTQAQTEAAYAALYPALYYPHTQVKQELFSPLPVEAPQTQYSAAKNLLRSFVSVAADATSSSSVFSPCAASSSKSSSSAASNFDEEEEINVLRCTPQIALNTATTSGATADAVNDSSRTVMKATTIATATPTATATAIPATRPFKAFPRDPLVIAAKFEANDALHDIPSGMERFQKFRKRMLVNIRHTNGGSRTVTNPKMRRINMSRSRGSPTSNTSHGNSENEERVAAATAAAEEDSCSDSESNAGNCAGDANSNQKDAAYYERRRKNNAAAKKSRDRRRIKEDEIAIRAAYLERQNIELLCQIESLKAQLAAINSKMIM